MKNRAFARALCGISHPVSVGAILIFLLNDHVIKALWPSWVTGKLSDVAGLMFAPLLLAALLAWLIPRRTPRHEGVVAGVSVGLTGIVWVLANAVPAVHAMVERAWGLAAGGDIHMVRDATDLLALPALWIAWCLYWQPGSRRETSYARGWMVMALGALAALATSGPGVEYDYGITRVSQSGDLLIAVSDSDRLQLGVFTSADSGVTWQRYEGGPFQPVQPPVLRGSDWEIQDPDHPNVRYRLSVNAAIERSEDAGQAWKREVDLKRVASEARRLVIAGKRYRHDELPAGYTLAKAPPEPADATIQKGTGVVLIAMGHDGILVRGADGEWRRVPVGPYLGNSTVSLSMLSPEMWTGIFVIPLVFMTIVYSRTMRLFGIVPVAVFWFLWITGGVIGGRGRDLTSTDTSFPVSPDIYPAVLLLSTLLFFPFIFGACLVIRRELNGGWLRIIGFCVLAFALFELPYLLWLNASIARHATAEVFSLALVATAIAAGVATLRRRQRPIRPTRSWPSSSP